MKGHSIDAQTTNGMKDTSSGIIFEGIKKNN